MSGIIPKEQLANCQPWQINSFDRKPVIKEEAPPPPVETPETAGEVVTGLALPTAEDIERIHEEARSIGYQAGFDEGRLAGEQIGQQVAQQEAERLTALCDNFQAALGTLDQQVADQLLGLSLEIAKQMTHAALKTNPEALLPVIREALTALPVHHAHVALHLNPVDAQHIRELIGEQFSQTGGQIIENTEISPGGCQVRAGASEVDATVETRWKRVLEAIGANPQDWLEQP